MPKRNVPEENIVPYALLCKYFVFFVCQSVGKQNERERMQRKRRAAIAGALLVGLYTMLGSATFALVQPEANISQFGVRTALLEIQISDSPLDNFGHDLQLSNTDYLLADGTEHSQEFWLKNMSSEGIGYDLEVQLTPGIGDWEALRDYIEVRIETLNSSTPWMSLAEMSAVQVDLSEPLLSGELRDYRLLYRLPTNYVSDPDGAGPLHVGDPIGNELQGKSVGGMELIISGTVSQG